jgi:surface-anchored protein
MRNSKHGFRSISDHAVQRPRVARFGSAVGASARGLFSLLALGLLTNACSSDAALVVAQSNGASELADAELGIQQEALQQEVSTLLGAVGSLDSAVQGPTTLLGDPYGRIQDAVGEVVVRAEALKRGLGEAGSEDDLKQLSIASGQLTVQVARLKRVVQAAGLDAAKTSELMVGLESVKQASRSLGVAVEEAQYALAGAPAGVDAQLRSSIEAFSGPLFPGSSWYVLSEGHIDAMDVGYEDAELGIVIHDETVVPSVERDPAKVIMVAKSASKTQVPDARFAFLGSVGADVWILPQGQPEAQAAAILWPGIATEEVDSGVFVDDEVQLRIRSVLGPNGVSLFESPEDEFALPLVLADSEDPSPDEFMTSVGLHRHVNWAFESPGVYLIKVQARGRLSAVAGNPWVKSPNVTLKFVVLP